MGMDLLRSCYETKMRFWQDDAREVKVRWFWCEEKAEVFPAHHRFGSGNWASDRFNWPGVGEVLDAPRLWLSGENPGELFGEKFCGPLRAYEEGALATDPPLNASVDGICCCCTCTCECDQLVERFTERMSIEVTQALGGGGAGAFHVGQTFGLTFFQPPGEFFWETDWIPVPLTPEGAIKLRVSCFDFGPGLRTLALGRAVAPDPEPTNWIIWIKEFCEPCYSAEVFDIFLVSGPTAQALTLRLTAQYRDLEP